MPLPDQKGAIMLAASFWSELGHAAQMELLAVAAILAVAIAVVVDLHLFIRKNHAPWKKTAVFFAVSELAVSVVSCWLGTSFGQTAGWCVFAVLTVAVLFFGFHFVATKWKKN